ncbi:DUF3450 domain-containing protein [Ketobacter sp.]
MSGLKSVAIIVSGVLWLGLGSWVVAQERGTDTRRGGLAENINVAQDMQKQAANSQARVDKLSADTEKMLQEYKRLTTDASYQGQYESELISLQRQQQQEIHTLQQRLESIQYTQQRLNPLMRSMVETLEQFVVLDLPFHQQQRLDSVIGLREKVFSGGLLLADKFRLLMEAYQAELEYGNTLESYREQIQLGGQAITVQCLRIGRVALYYLTLDGAQAGTWDRQQRDWVTLPEAHIGEIKQGLKIAAGRIAPELLQLPLVQPGTGQ